MQFEDNFYCCKMEKMTCTITPTHVSCAILCVTNTSAMSPSSSKGHAICCAVAKTIHGQEHKIATVSTVKIKK